MNHVRAHILGVLCSAMLLVAPGIALAAPVSCVAQGGHCANFCATGEENVAATGCMSPETCCKNAAVTPPSPPPSGSTAAAGGSQQASAPDCLVLPACTKTGNCSLADIVQTGINFATFLMGLSAALFFAVFVYGGAMYLLSFGNKSMVDKGRTAIKGAAIGMIFVLGAWTIVQTLVKGIGGPVTGAGGTAGGGDKCTAQGTGYSGQSLSGVTAQQALADAEIKSLTCKTGLCPGAVNVLCCKAK